METLSKYATLYVPEANTTIIGTIQIIHGMAEHQKRYQPLAAFLNQHGLVVVTSDLRGHGDNVNREEELGYFGDHAVTRLLADIHDITVYLKTNYPDKPCFLLGHSMGTLVSTCYFKKYDNFIDGLFLSGMPGQNSATGIAKFLIKLLATFKGEYHRSKFIDTLCNGPFAKPFADEGSAFAWLATDKEVVRTYEDDPKCGFIFTLNGFYTLMELMDGTYKTGSWIKKNPNCPIKLMSGADDPCMGNQGNFMNSVELFRKQGYKNVDYVLYPGQRHEIFNDTQKETARNDLLQAIRKLV